MVNYICYRCGYETNKKSNIMNHYNKKKICKVVLENISIEDCLLKLNEKELFICQYCNKEFQKKYNLTRHKISCQEKYVKNLEEENSKLKEKEENSKLEENKEDQFIYLVKTREFINSGESIYKLGKTRNPKNRLSSYPKGSRVYLLLKCFDCDKFEKDLLLDFSCNFSRVKDIGLEYFEGDIDEMIDKIIELKIKV